MASFNSTKMNKTAYLNTLNQLHKVAARGPIKDGYVPATAENRLRSYAQNSLISPIFAALGPAPEMPSPAADEALAYARKHVGKAPLKPELAAKAKEANKEALKAKLKEIAGNPYVQGGAAGGAVVGGSAAYALARLLNASKTGKVLSTIGGGLLGGVGGGYGGYKLDEHLKGRDKAKA